MKNHVPELSLGLIEKIGTLRDEIGFYQANWVKSVVKLNKGKSLFPGFPVEKTLFNHNTFSMTLFYTFAIFLYF